MIKSTTYNTGVNKRDDLQPRIKYVAKRRHTRLSLAILALCLSLLILLIFLVYLFWPTATNPVPVNIRRQLSFPPIFPISTSHLTSQDWQYKPNPGLLTFQITGKNYTVVVAEQEVPIAYKDDAAAYQRFIGSLRPYANFNVPLGTASLVNFITEGTYDPEGAAGILKTDKTMIIIHPQTDITQDQWYDLFNSLRQN